MSHARPAGLVLGSVQLGLPYGIANRTGQPSRAAALRLVRKAVDRGVAEFDTARAYGDSEARLGEALRDRKSVRTITKLSPLTEVAPDARREEVRAAVDRSISESLVALKRGRLECLLLHRAEQMTAFRGAVWERLIELLEDGTLLALGVSVQTPDEALAALDNRDVQHLQVPFNLLDWRWRETGVIDRIRARSHVTIHARSVFLQGLLISGDPAIWPSIEGFDPRGTIALVASLAREFGRENLADLCLAYARGQDWIDGVVVGMETEAQLEANLGLFVRPPLAIGDCETIACRAPRVPEQLLNPALWPRRS
jgi:aryl-alcohol dehydrogenase-like predicted oxidoreductase